MGDADGVGVVGDVRRGHGVAGNRALLWLLWPTPSKADSTPTSRHVRLVAKPDLAPLD